MRRNPIVDVHQNTLTVCKYLRNKQNGRRRRATLSEYLSAPLWKARNGKERCGYPRGLRTRAAAPPKRADGLLRSAA